MESTTANDRKLRLLITPRCTRGCVGCCNKDWDIDNLPTCNGFAGYSEVLLTGGEPMLVPNLVLELVPLIRLYHDGPIFMYTANIRDTLNFLKIYLLVDGVTITLHDQSDVKPWVNLARRLKVFNFPKKSLRLNVFEGVELPKDPPLDGWLVKSSIKWIKDCPLPEGEVLMKLWD